MKEEIGAKGGKKDRKLTLLNIFKHKKRIKKEEEELKQKQEKEEKLYKEKIQLPKQEEIIENEIININIKKEKKDLTHHNQKEYITKETNQKPTTISPKKTKPKSNTPSKEEIPPINKKQDNLTNTPKNITEDKSITQKPNQIRKPKGKSISYIEKEIIHVLDETIKENNYELKKLDSDIYTLKQTIDNTEEENIEDLEKEIDDIITRFNHIKEQLEKLKRTFDLDFPIDNADNYLIYLIDEYKENLKTKQELSDRLENNEKYKTILSRIIDLEIEKDQLIEKTEERKETLDIEKETLDKMDEDIVNIENKANEIKTLVDKSTNQLEEIELKLKETVHITERFKIITKSVNHSILELLLLMNLLKHHLSLKNNAVNAIAASVTLGLIIKMCTPVEEQVLIKESDVKDYKKMITDCIDDTDKLLDTIKNNLDQISAIRYTFENDYKELSRLPMYKEITNKLDELENDMKERLDSTKKLTRDMNLQLEKNNAKVKKYKNLEAA